MISVALEIAQAAEGNDKYSFSLGGFFQLDYRTNTERRTLASETTTLCLHFSR